MLFGPSTDVIINVRDFMEQHPRQMQGRPLASQVRIAVAGVLGTAAATGAFGNYVIQRIMAGIADQQETDAAVAMSKAFNLRGNIGSGTPDTVSSIDEPIVKKIKLGNHYIIYHGYNKWTKTCSY